VPLVLPRDHPASSGLEVEGRGEGALRVGIINIMPRLEAYEPLLLRRLADAPAVVEPVFVRLESHDYKSSDHAHLDRFYRSFARAGRLDGLIITGAPVEEIEFEAVHYWTELVAIMQEARRAIRSTLGICWGGLALGALLGIPKVALPQKLFGVFEHRLLPGGGTARCAHSRHSGADDAALERAAAAGSVRLIAHAPEIGYAIFASADHRFVAHLGHPEYEAYRLVFELERDRLAGRTDVPPPCGLDIEHPTTSWREDSDAFFAGWLALLR
jgi:homoserine O-succinyltransferase